MDNIIHLLNAKDQDVINVIDKKILSSFHKHYDIAPLKALVQKKRFAGDALTNVLKFVCDNTGTDSTSDSE